MNNLVRNLVKNYPLILLMSAFTPYITPTSGIKGDNIVIYLFALFALGVLIKRQKLDINKDLSILFVVWLSVFIFLVTRTILGGGYISEYSLIAEIKNFSQPLAIIFIFLVLRVFNKKDNFDLILKRACLILIMLLSVNTVWIFISINFDVSFINQYFQRGVAINAAGNNRYSGLFNQPMESGIAYSVGLFSWIYLVSKKHITVKLKYVIILMLLFIGGMVSVSKIFIFGGIGLFFVNLIFRKKSFMNLWKLLLWIPIIIPLSFVYLSNNWQGVSYLNRLFTLENYREQGALFLLSGGRFSIGSESSQEQLFDKVWEVSPLIGQGMGSQTVYDSAFFHFFSSGGLLSLILYIFILIYLLSSSIKFFANKIIREESIFFFNIVVLILVASFGSPVLTVNRASVVVWVFVCLLICYNNRRRKLYV